MFPASRFQVATPATVLCSRPLLPRHAHGHRALCLQSDYICFQGATPATVFGRRSLLPVVLMNTVNCVASIQTLTSSCFALQQGCDAGHHLLVDTINRFAPAGHLLIPYFLLPGRNASHCPRRPPAAARDAHGHRQPVCAGGPSAGADGRVPRQPPVRVCRLGLRQAGAGGRAGLPALPAGPGAPGEWDEWNPNVHDDMAKRNEE